MSELEPLFTYAEAAAALQVTDRDCSDARSEKTRVLLRRVGVAEEDLPPLRVETAEPSEAPKVKRGHIYLVQTADARYVKIGFAKSVKHRVANLQTAHAEPLQLLAAALGTTADEASLHGEFGAHRVSGEWFKHGPWVDGLIARLAAMS